MARSKSSPIFVAIRVRPFAPHEDSDKCCIDVQEKTGEAVISLSGNGSKLEFSMDAAFNDGCDPLASIEEQQDQVYNVVGKRLLEQALQGFHVATFAYGSTGTGKTTTMIGQPSAEGLAPRLLRDLFDNVHRFEIESRQVHFRVRLCEIHNERLRDLLRFAHLTDIHDQWCSSVTSNHEQPSLSVHAHPKLGVYVPGLRGVPVESAEEAYSLLCLGTELRETTMTAMNQQSSRGHVIFTITVEEQSEERSRIISELSCVDLAGRENEKTTTVTGKQLVELTFINKSLFHLANCISGLQRSNWGPVCKQGSQGNRVQGPKSSKAQFRNSKLTLLLSQAISGNSCTAMVGTLSPALCSHDETLRTLRFATSIRSIRLAATASVQKQAKSADAASRQHRLEAQLQTCKAVSEINLPAELSSQLKLPFPCSQSKASLELDELLQRLEEVKQPKFSVRRQFDISDSLTFRYAMTLVQDANLLLHSAKKNEGMYFSIAELPSSSQSNPPDMFQGEVCVQLLMSGQPASVLQVWTIKEFAALRDQMQDEAMEEPQPHSQHFKCIEKQIGDDAPRESVMRRLMRLRRSTPVRTRGVGTSTTRSSLLITAFPSPGHSTARSDQSSLSESLWLPHEAPIISALSEKESLLNGETESYLGG